MWPWEHLAVGYLAYAALVHLVARRPPAGDAVVVLAVATQLPDLIDKPLAWSLAVLPSGASLAHSLAFALPATLVALALARRVGHTRLGVAFAVGYLLHLPADALYPALLGRGPKVAFLFWPFVPVPAGSASGFLPQFEALLSTFLAYLATPRGTAYLVGEVVLLGSALALYAYDGTPGLRWLRRGARARRRPAPPDE
jgi:hypothetical protein